MTATGKCLRPRSHRRWYSATIVALRDEHEDSYHTVLHEHVDDGDTGACRRELAILQLGDRVEPNDNTVRFGAWCIGAHHRGHAALGADPAVPVPPATPISRRAPPSWQRGRTAADVVRRYFEAQVGWQCGIHAVNNAIGAEALTVDGVAAYITAGLRWREAGAGQPMW
mmetsp:Transcript_27264/g.73729  ORF Transcript_27264/g.73729 Transcript_27264/m.73729 type:complete len:169 (+) Transcript_27264:347-853(+)